MSSLKYSLLFLFIFLIIIISLIVIIKSGTGSLWPTQDLIKEILKDGASSDFKFICESFWMMEYKQTFSIMFIFGKQMDFLNIRPDLQLFLLIKLLIRTRNCNLESSVRLFQIKTCCAPVLSLWLPLSGVFLSFFYSQQYHWPSLCTVLSQPIKANEQLPVVGSGGLFPLN